MAAEGVGIVFCSVEAIIAIVRAITEAVETVRQNKEECEDIAKCVASVSAVLKRMYVLTPAMAMDPAMRGALEDLAVSLERALDLVKVCQHGDRLPRFLGARDMARELRRMQEDISRKVMVGIFAVVSVQTLPTMPCASAPPPPSPPPAGAAWSWNPVPPSMAPWLNPAPSIPYVEPWSMPAPSVAAYAWSNPVPSLAPQPMPWPRPAWPSMADFCCPNNS